VVDQTQLMMIKLIRIVLWRKKNIMLVSGASMLGFSRLFGSKFSASSSIVSSCCVDTSEDAVKESLMSTSALAWL